MTRPDPSDPMVLRYLEALLEHTDDYVMVADADALPVLYNDAYAEIMEYAFGVSMRPGFQPHTMIPDPAAHAWWEGLHARVLAGERFREDYDYAFPDGRVRHFEISYCPIREGDEVVGFTEITRDITARREADLLEAELRDALARARRMESLGVLAGGVAHDLNNILGPVVALPDLMEVELEEILAGRGTEAHHKSLRRALHLVSTSARRAANAVQDLLFLGRRGKRTPEPLDLLELPALARPDETYADLLRRYPGVDVAVARQATSLPVLGEAMQLGRVVRNLVQNAVEAVGGGGRVFLRASHVVLDEPLVAYEPIPAGSWAVLEVVDDGPGIPEEHLERLLEPFFTTKARSGERGSGLGLAVVHAITKDHGGCVDVRSQVGQGTVVRLYLPLMEGAPDRARAPETEVPVGTERVLVVDDDEGQRDVALRILERLGYTAVAVADGESALARFRAAHRLERDAPCDLVLLDMALGPGMDGVATLEALHALYPGQRVLIVSGHAPDDRGRAALERGACWLTKPYDVPQLAGALRQCLEE